MDDSQPTYANASDLAKMLEMKAAVKKLDRDEKDSIKGTDLESDETLETKLTYTEAIETLIYQAESNVSADVSLCDTESPIIDVKSIGSVADRASMFEKKLIKPQQPSPLPSYHANNILLNSALNLSRETVARLESIYGKKTEEVLGRVEKMDTGGKKLIILLTCDS